MDQTQILPPALPTGRELYDAIMGYIEPELTSEGAKTLAAKYKNESNEERETRLQRYELAFERYEEAYTGYLATLGAQVTRYSREAYSHAEARTRHRESGFLDSLEAQFSQAA